MDEQVTPTTTTTKKPLGKIMLVLFVLLLLGIGAGVFLRNSQAPVTVPQKTDQPAGPEVMITAKGFEPATIQVTVGTQVTFINNDSSQHQVASDPHPIHNGLAGFDSVDPLQTNDTYSFTFEKPGTFTYHDHLNPFKFKGTVIVK